MTSHSDLIRGCYSAYVTKDRELLERLLADDFTFSSPRDDHIDRATYFEKCWPNSETMQAIRIEKLFEDGDEAFVLYELQLKSGRKFCNTEFFRIENGKVKQVDVYFGRDV